MLLKHLFILSCFLTRIKRVWFAQIKIQKSNLNLFYFATEKIVPPKNEEKNINENLASHIIIEIMILIMSPFKEREFIILIILCAVFFKCDIFQFMPAPSHTQNTVNARRRGYNDPLRPTGRDLYNEWSLY